MSKHHLGSIKVIVLQCENCLGFNNLKPAPILNLLLLFYRRTGVSGSMVGAGSDIVLVQQHATLLDTLTTKEILLFAAALKLPNASRTERNYIVSTLSEHKSGLVVHLDFVER